MKSCLIDHPSQKHVQTNQDQFACPVTFAVRKIIAFYLRMFSLDIPDAFRSTHIYRLREGSSCEPLSNFYKVCHRKNNRIVEAR